MSTTPYSDEWREHTRARMTKHGITSSELGKRTGLGHDAIDAIWLEAVVTLEVAGPIDEELDRLDAAVAPTARRPPLPATDAPRVAPVTANLGALDGARVVLRRRP